MPELTAENVYGLAVTYAAAYPDAVYEPPPGVDDSQCFYTLGTLAGRAGCLYGQVLFDLGVPKETLEAADDSDGGVPITALLENVLGLHIPTADMRNKLQRAQMRQDERKPLRKVFDDA